MSLLRKPLVSVLNDASDVVLLTPDGPIWNPHSALYTNNEESTPDDLPDLTQHMHVDCCL